MSDRHTQYGRSLVLALAAVLGPGAAHAYSAQITFTASDFLVRSGALYFPEEVAPQAEVSGSFTVGTDQPRDLPDEPFTVEASDESPGYSGVNTWTSPVSSDLTILGVAYPPEDVQVHLGFVEGEIALILVGARAGRAPAELPAHVATAGTNDFVLVVEFPGPAGGSDGRFTYTTADAPHFGFQSQSGQVTVASDVAPIQTFEWVAPLVVAGTACYVAEAVPDAAAGLDAETRPGNWICDDPIGDDFDAGAAGVDQRLRDARPAAVATAGRAASSETVAVTTALGTLTLRAKPPDRVLLRASAGRSAAPAAPEPGEATRCAKVRRAPGTPRLALQRDVRLAGALARYDVRKPTRLCESDGAGERVLCYSARARGQKARSSELWVAHELGVEKLRVGRAKEICLPVTDE